MMTLDLSHGRIRHGIRYETGHEFRRVAGYFQARAKSMGFYMIFLEEYEFDNTNRLHL